MARRPLRRSRRRGARENVPGAGRHGESAEGDHCRHREGEGRFLHGRSGDGRGPAVRLSLGGTRREAVHRRAGRAVDVRQRSL